jgi:hypothetical protein
MNELSSLARNSMARDLVRGGVPGQRDQLIENRRRRVAADTGGDHLDAVLELVVNRPGVDRVHPDAPRRELAGKRPHQPDQSVLGGRIAGDVRGRGQAHHARGDDNAGTLRQMRYRVLAQQERAAHVHRERLVERVLRVVGDRRDRAGDPGVGDHHVKPSEPADSGVHGGLHLRRVGDVGHRPGCPVAQLGRARLQVRFGDSGQEDAGSFGGERAGGRHPDAALAAGYDGSLALKSAHEAIVLERVCRGEPTPGRGL